MEKQPNVTDAPSERHPDALWEIEDVAKYLGVSALTVRKHVNESGLPAKRIGSLLRFRREEVDAWIDQQHIDPETDNREAASA